MIWFLVNIVGAFCWFGFACGFVEPASWMATVAFVLVGLDCVVSAMKALVTA